MKRELKQILATRQKQHIAPASRIPAAILMPIYEKQGQHYILFTKRTEDVKTHKGQISFPGGVYEEKDGTLVETALRESEEEIDLRPQDVEVVGELDDTPSVASNYIITPFIGFIPWPYQFKIDPREVNKIIEVPISALLNSDSLHQETVMADGQPVTTLAYNYSGDIIWGATAKILNQFLGIWTQVMKNSSE